MRRAPRLLLLSLATPLALGCSAQASLSLSTPGEDRPAATGRTQVSTSGAARPVRIVRAGDQLRYENGEIEFETNSAALKDDATARVLDQLAVVLKRYPSLLVRIEGHTDSRGSLGANQRLSEDRARAIEAALVERGVPDDRLSAVGRGENHPEIPEPPACHNRVEARIPAAELPRCHEVWTANRRAAFVVTDGADSLPADGTAVSEPAAGPTAPRSAASKPRRPDWALRVFGGYTLALPDEAFHGGHLGLGLHASQRFGARRRGYIGGGPRLHYRGVRRSDIVAGASSTLAIHQFGPEGNLLVGGGSSRVVGLFSLRLGLGLSAQRGTVTDDVDTVRVARDDLGGWLLGGVVVLGKLSPRWSLGAHAELGVIGTPDLALATELGLNLAWHFGRGRRDGI